MTATMWGYGPKNEELTTRKQKREEEQAGQLGEVLLEFGVTSRSANTTKKKQVGPPETGVTHITRKNVKEMLQRKVGTARSVHNIVNISKTLKLSTLTWQFRVIGTASRKTIYKVDISNTPTCPVPRL